MPSGGSLAPSWDMWHSVTAQASLSIWGTTSSLPKWFRHTAPQDLRVQLLQARPWLVLHVSWMQPLSWLSLCWDSMLYSCLSIIYVCVHCRYQSGFWVCISVAAVHVGGGG